MAKIPTKKRPRKRRSFFEPDSKALTQWINDQNDLSLSMQLIIVDAIRNYGEGDAIQALIKGRVSDVSEKPLLRTNPEDKIVDVLTAPKKAVSKPVAAKTALSPVSPKPEPVPNIPTPTVTESESQPVVKTAIPEEPVRATLVPEPVNPEPIVPLPAEPEQPVQSEQPTQSNDKPYDPLEIMFQDIGSGFNK